MARRDHRPAALDHRFDRARLDLRFGPRGGLRSFGLAFRLTFGPGLGAFGARGFAAGGPIVVFIGGKCRHGGACEKQEKQSFTHRSILILKDQLRTERAPRQMSRCLTGPIPIVQVRPAGGAPMGAAAAAARAIALRMRG